MPSKSIKPFFIYLIIGFIAAVSFSSMIHYGIGSTITYTWIGFYALMFLLAYKHQPSLLRLASATLLPSFLATAPFIWPHQSPTSLPVLAITSAYALNAFHINFQKNGLQWCYETLFHAVWDTFIELCTATLFTLLCWGILLIWAALFNLININFFTYVFHQPWFVSWSWPFFLAIGLYIAHQATPVVRSLRLFLMAFCRYLLPPLALVSLLFFIVSLISITIYHNHIPININLFLTLSVFSIILINGVYQDGKISVSYPIIIKAVIISFFIITPFLIFSILYDLLLNPDVGILKHGLYADTFATLLNTCILLSYNLCYAVIVTLKKRPWLSAIKPCNIFLAILLILLTLWTNNNWFNRSRFNPKTKNSLTLINKSNAIKEKLLKKYQDQFNQSKFHWIKRNTSPPLILGLNPKPIYLCRSNINNLALTGVIQNNSCAFIYKHKITVSNNYTALYGPIKKIIWKQWAYGTPTDNSFPLTVNHTSKTTSMYICRTIYNNKIYIGISAEILNSRCLVITGTRIRSLFSLQYLHIKP